MEAEIKILDRNNKDEISEYNEYVKEMIFEYSIEWMKILEDNFGFKGYYIIAKEKNKIVGCLPLFMAKGIFGNRLVSTPYAIITEVKGQDKIKEQIVNFSKELARKKGVDYFEIREKKEANIFHGFKMVKNVFNFYLHLGNIDQVWKKLPKGSVRWGVKKAEKCGITWTAGKSTEYLDRFYTLYVYTRKVRGVPAYPYNYLRDIIGKFDVKIYISSYNNKDLAGIFLIYNNEEVRYMFAGALHKPEFLSLQPYHLIIWESIKDACNKGFKVYNFGGASLDTNDGGLYDFKKKWADEIVEVPYYFYLNKAKKIPKGNRKLFSIASKLWRILPASIVRILSPKVIRQFV